MRSIHDDDAKNPRSSFRLEPSTGGVPVRMTGRMGGASSVLIRTVGPCTFGISLQVHYSAWDSRSWRMLEAPPFDPVTERRGARPAPDSSRVGSFGHLTSAPQICAMRL